MHKLFLFQVCNKPLECSYHKCSEVCHGDVCAECPLSKTRTCPCGKISYNLPCTEVTPTCGDTCGKMLECGKHICHQRCHKDACGTVRKNNFVPYYSKFIDLSPKKLENL